MSPGRRQGQGQGENRGRLRTPPHFGTRSRRQHRDLQHLLRALSPHPQPFPGVSYCRFFGANRFRHAHRRTRRRSYVLHQLSLDLHHDEARILVPPKSSPSTVLRWVFGFAELCDRELMRLLRQCTFELDELLAARILGPKNLEAWVRSSSFRSRKGPNPSSLPSTTASCSTALRPFTAPTPQVLRSRHPFRRWEPSSCLPVVHSNDLCSVRNPMASR